MVARFHKFTNIIDLYVHFRRILWHINYASIKLLKNLFRKTKYDFVERGLLFAAHRAKIGSQNKDLLP